MSGWNQEQEYQAGIRAERERIIKLLEDYNSVQDSEWDYYIIEGIDKAIALIEDETKMITSEIMPDGSILIQEVKGETEEIKKSG